ncbi:MAG: hypothetical protein GF311_22035 [Candidatus Lokiarchaeota archaeon]|nr:hypothetical protein [Candidatus Lokiarchaeota archaeon]
MGKRLGSVDFFRGFCMFLMFLGHLSIWWMDPIAFRIQELTLWIPLEPFAKGGGFILISGTSLALSFSKQKIDYRDPNKTNIRIIRNTSYIRGFLLFLVALAMNFGLLFNNPDGKIYDWWILFTLSICLILSWPLMRLSLNLRIVLGISLLIFNYFFYQILITNLDIPLIPEILEFIYPSDARQNPILLFFPFFLFGTVLGTHLSEKGIGDNWSFDEFFKKIVLPFTIPSIMAILFGVLFEFPNFLITNSFSYIIYALGLNTMIITILLTLEKTKTFNFKSKYNPLFYFSFYSLTFYLMHYSFMIFGEIMFLDYFSFWIVFFIMLLLVTVFFKIMFRTIGLLFSLKYFLSITGEYLSLKIEESFYNRDINATESFIKKLKITISPKK